MEATDSIQDKIEVSEITENDWQKTRKDLSFISLMSQLAKGKGCRVIVSGGYAVDGNLGKITRPHQDIDIQIYGQNNANGQLVNELVEDIKKGSSFPQIEVTDRGRQEFYHGYFIEGNGIGADIYYVQVAENPDNEDRIVIKSDGSYTERQKYDTVEVNLEGVVFEAINPTSELIDKLYKREVRGDKPKAKHDQDIANLKLISNIKEVETKLKEKKES